VKLANFQDAQIASITVEAPAVGATDGAITITLSNGSVFKTAAGLGSALADGSTTTLTSTTDPNEQIKLTLGTINLATSAGNAIVLRNGSEAAAAESALKEALGIGSGKGGINFQVGGSSTSTIKVAIQGVATDSLYKDSDGIVQDLDIGSAVGAQSAASVLTNAINNLTSVRANVGALQSRFDFASANLETSIQNEDAARGAFLDTDVATESTNFATAQVLLQASVAVLAQANQIPQNLLKLIG